MVTEPHSSQSVLESLSSCFGFDPRHWLVQSSPTVPVDTAAPARHQISHTVRDLVNIVERLAARESDISLRS